MVTQSMSRLGIERERCGICGACVPVCPSEALVLHDSFLEIVADRCSECKKCISVCPTHALVLRGGEAV